MIPVPGRGIGLRTLVVLLFGLFAFDNVLLLAFLGFGPGAAILAALPALLLLWLVRQHTPAADRVGWRTLALCFGTALVLLVLGGEGRFLYANPDWQVRDAVLRDMAHHDWPFVYAMTNGPALLRAPIGMYLLPALLGGSDLALLATNALRLGLLFAAASPLFTSGRARAIAMMVFIAFGGLDLVGGLLAGTFDIHGGLKSLESWAFGTLQYSSSVVLIFWVPPHAFAGWFCALTFLLWQQGRLPWGAMAAAVPLTAIWSPLAMLGAVPFALYATTASWQVPRRVMRDIPMPIAAMALAAPALSYLGAGASSVGFSLQRVPGSLLALFLAIEVAPLAAIALWRPGRFGRRVPAFAVLILVLIPIGVVGSGQDFEMRASIPALAILALAVGDAVAVAWASDNRRRAGVPVMMAILGLGAVTGVVEVARAFALPPSPLPRCSLPGVWNQQSQRIKPIIAYLAPYAAVPPALRPRPPSVVDPGSDPARCWDTPWPMPD